MTDEERRREAETVLRQYRYERNTLLMLFGGALGIGIAAVVIALAMWMGGAK